MPHQCTSCGRTFPDGSKEMLSGCPDCGGNKFQFQPNSGSTATNSSTTNTSTTTPSTTNSPTTTPPATNSPTEVRQSNSSADSPSERTSDDTRSTKVDSSDLGTEPEANPASGGEVSEPEADPDPASAGTEHIDARTEEDVAQASARSDVVSPDELDQASQDVDAGSDTATPNDDLPEGPRPDIGDLRDELNDQFESIRIVSPGKYELNLMELYDRQEYIISLQEDGRYVIEMPDSWGISDE